MTAIRAKRMLLLVLRTSPQCNPSSSQPSFRVERDRCSSGQMSDCMAGASDEGSETRAPTSSTRQARACRVAAVLARSTQSLQASRLVPIVSPAATSSTRSKVLLVFLLLLLVATLLVLGSVITAASRSRDLLHRLPLDPDASPENPDPGPKTLLQRPARALP